MPLHMIKLVVGCDTIDELADWYKTHPCIVHTRQTPKRAQEVLDGGSIYRIIKGQILLRQKILDIQTLGQAGGVTRCEIHMDPQFVLVTPTPRRAFQGWRYFDATEAPDDLESGVEGAVPGELAAQLRALGAW